MSSHVATSPFVAVRPTLRHPRSEADGRSAGQVLVLGGAESAFAFCRAASEAEHTASSNGNGNGHRAASFHPIAIAFAEAPGSGGDAGSNGRAEAGPFSAWELTADRLRHLTSEESISELVIADPAIENEPTLVEAILDCKARGIRVRDSVAMYERLFHKVRLESLTPRRVLYSEDAAVSDTYLFLKRTLDILLSLPMLLLAAPIMLLAAIAVRLESSGSAIFSQERVGLRGKPFRIYKLRSMREDAEANGPQWAGKKDDRVTRVGAFLRRHHIDELPQLVNVLRGDMSLIGPRPERPCFVEMLSERIPYYGLRHHAKPGVSGWAQVEYEYGDSVEDAWEKLQYDLYYTRNASLRLDFVILLKTVKAVLGAKGR